MSEIVVPFNDLHAQYLELKTEIDTAIAEVIKNSFFIRGPFVEEFETKFAEIFDTKHCISCANGTDAIYIALMSLGLKPGDEVIAPAHSWISTTETITQAGGKVVFCDTDQDTYTVDPKLIESKINKNTVGILPVHLYGHPADMDPIMSLARKHNLWVVEDCAQAHLAEYKGKKVGTFGNAAAFSFYPGKNLGAMGDAGAIITNDQSLATKMTMFARHGGLKKGDHQIEGINSRLDGIQAAVLLAKLPYLSQWTRLRQARASRYNALLSQVAGIETPHISVGNEHVWHLYVIRHENRGGLAKHLNDNGIQTIINYPVALPFLPAYARFNLRPEDFPVAFHHQSRILSLPIFPELSDSQVDFVVNSIEQYCKTNGQ